MTSESENKSLARRFLEELGNKGVEDRLSEFLAPEYVAHHSGIAGIEQAREHLLTFQHCYPDMVVMVEGQVAEGDIVATWYMIRGTHPGGFGGCASHGETDYLAGGQCSENPEWPNYRALGRQQLPGGITGARSGALGQ